jgi:hypothetical protein
MDEMIYVVSGYMRTGTSMMMKALTDGGLESAFDSNRDVMNEKYGDDNYKPNPAGFYELHRKEYQQKDFPTMYKGKLVKCLIGGLNSFPVSNYRIVFMRRDPEEIRQSFDAFFESVPLSQRKQVKNFLTQYDEIMDDFIARLKNRRDTHLIIFQYRKVVEDPLYHFQHLANCGWPIDPEKAAATVDSKLCRFRIENLTVGI